MLLHPLGADRSVWAPVTDLLGAERETFAVDLPGFGDSPALAGDTSPAALADTVHRGLVDIGVHEYDVAGNSLGGWVALELALTGRARSVVAIGPAGLWREPLPPPARPCAHARAAGAAVRGADQPRERLRGFVLAGFVAHPDRVPAAAAADLIRAYARAPGFPRVNAAMRAGTFSGLDRIEVPVTLAWPDHDRIVSRPSRLPSRVRSVVLRGCGHLPFWDDPRQVAALLTTAH